MNPLSAFKSAKPARPYEPIPEELATANLTVPVGGRTVVIVSPDPRRAYRLKASLLKSGHRRVETFFKPEILLQMIATGLRPDVVMVDDFTGGGSNLTGIELVRKLRLEHEFRGLAFSLSPDHRTLPAASLRLHGFSGPLGDYFGG